MEHGYCWACERTPLLRGRLAAPGPRRLHQNGV